MFRRGQVHNVLMESADRRLVISLESLFRVFRSAATAGQLSLPAASVLGRLVRDGAQRLTELAVAEQVSQPAMTQLVARLERDGLARKMSDDSDGRAVLVDVTAHGRRLVEQRREERAAFIHHLLSALPDEDVAAIHRSIDALEHLAQVARQVSYNQAEVLR
jgi:DNA-binding MarR family transcriptional regulator